MRSGSKCTSSQAASAQKFKDLKSIGWERQSPTLPVCPSANHSLGTFPLIMSVGYGHYMMKGFGTLPAFCQERFLEQRRKSETQRNGGSLPMRTGGLRLRSAARCAEVASWALWEDAMSMIAQGNLAVGKAAAESLNARERTDRMDRDGFWCRLCTLRRASRLATLVR